MASVDVDHFIVHAREQYFAPGEYLLTPAMGPVQHLYFLRLGGVSRQQEVAARPGDAFQYEAGDLFPMDAAVLQSPVSASYQAVGDTFVLALPHTALLELMQRSAVMTDYLNQHMLKLLEHSRQAMQEASASKLLAEQSLETPLGDLMRSPVLACRPITSLQQALTAMHQHRVGSMLVTSENGQALGILSLRDVLSQVALPGLSLQTPIDKVMAQPVHCLRQEDTAHDAALLMSRLGIRHVPITCNGAAVGMVSERDLFAFQRLSLKQLGDDLRTAADVPALRQKAPDIHRLAHHLLSQGVQAPALTSLISHLNDVLTQRLLVLKAASHGIDMDTLCWLALGSEGRSEQTIATDQDNALILADGCSEDERTRVLAFAQDVNQALAECGYPLCKGGVMAGQAPCCLSLSQWRSRFAAWIEHGAPDDLLKASIFFDFRPLAGDAALANALRSEVQQRALASPRFLKQLAINALQRSVPLNWLGAMATDEQGRIDLKLQGAAIFVDAARLYALAHGVSACATHERLQTAGAAMGLAPSEYEAWVSSFEFLQMLRLRIQLHDTQLPANANLLQVKDLNDIDRRILREVFRQAHALQQRMHLDYER